MRPLRLLLVTLALAPAAPAQTWNANAGGYNTGYGTVYGSFGVAMATQNIYNSVQLNMQRAMARSAMVKKFGLAAVEKAEREAKSGRPPADAAAPKVAPPPVARGLGKFKPVKSVNGAKQLADALGGSAEEKALVSTIASATRQAFEAEPATKSWRNNVAGALAFFILSSCTIAQDAAEPSEATGQALFASLNQTLDESPDFAKASDADKQRLYELLLGFTGMPLAIYTEGKERGDAEQVGQARALARQLFQLVMKADADAFRLQP